MEKPGEQCTVVFALKVLSSEMDPAQARLIPEIFIKGSVAAAF
jgi:hypothetical protein